MITYARKLAEFIATHPLARRHKARAYTAVARWQIGSRLLIGPTIVPFVNGSRLLAERGMTGATGNIYSGLHEFEDMGFLLHFLRPDDLFVDIGANIGSYTILASAAIGAATIAFEPVPETHEWLRLNVAINDIDNKVERRREALGDKPGRIGFTLNRGPSNRVAVPTSAEDANRIDVEITTLDAALAGRCPALMKIDVEGYETATIAGASQTLANPALKAIIMEFNGQGAHFGYDEKALRAKMADLGFAEFSYSPFERRLVGLDNAQADNIILVRDKAFVDERIARAPRFSAFGEDI